MKLHIAAVLVLLVAGCAPPATRPTPSPPDRAGKVEDARVPVGELLDAWHAAAARADEAVYFELLDDAGVFLGTDATERWDEPAFRAYAHPHFAKGKAWSFRATRRSVTTAPGGDLAWFDEDLATPGLGPARGSGVAVRRANGWRVLHYVLSITVPNDRFDVTKEAATDARVLEPGGALVDLGWMAGSWVGASGAAIVEEQWMTPAGTSSLGARRATAHGRTAEATQLRIEARKEGVTLRIEPRVGPPLELRRVDATSDAARATFADEVTGARISYERKGAVLLVQRQRVAGEADGTWELAPAVLARPMPKPGR